MAWVFYGTAGFGAEIASDKIVIHFSGGRVEAARRTGRYAATMPLLPESFRETMQTDGIFKSTVPYRRQERCSSIRRDLSVAIAAHVRLHERRHASWKTGIISAFIAHVRSSLQERVPSMLTSDGGPPPATEAAYMDQSMRRAWASAAFRKVQQPSC